MASTSNPDTHESCRKASIKIRMMCASVSYWNSKFIQCLANPTYIHCYPHCLFFLELLQNLTFRNAMAHPANKAEKEEVDLRSIYVGNVDYACLPGEVKQHFQACGTVNRVTILTDKLGQPKGFAYVEFFEMEAVQNALLLNESELHGRKLKVSAKRTNVPGMKQFRGRRFNPYAGFRPRRAFVPGAPAIPPFGRVPRFRRSIRYRPY